LNVIGLGYQEKSMSRSNYKLSAVAALVSAAMLTLPLDQASAFTLSASHQSFASAPVEKTWWRGGWGWRGGRWGWWGPGAVIGGLAAGAIVGSALAAPYYGYPGPYGYGGCWRRVWGYYGWQWARVC
jgi:hypothetical protein